jgi:hypothetical protein
LTNGRVDTRPFALQHDFSGVTDVQSVPVQSADSRVHFFEPIFGSI